MNKDIVIRGFLAIPPWATADDPMSLARHLQGSAPDLFTEKAARALLDAYTSPYTGDDAKAQIWAALCECPPSFRQLRLHFGLTQQAIADRFRIPKRTVENWDSGSRTPQDYLILMLLQLLIE